MIYSQLNGSTTLHENFCDNVGLTLVHKLFEKSMNEITDTKVLPGLEKFTQDQLFFISYGSVSKTKPLKLSTFNENFVVVFRFALLAQLCCTTESKEFLKWHMKDEHAPMRYRLLGPLRNMPEFAKAFQCKNGSYMNPIATDVERCSIF
jgi:predicted metalloendopeptidase